MSHDAGADNASANVAICVPARDEAARVPRLFEGLDRLAIPGDRSVHVCLLLDGCTDQSAAIVAAYARGAAHRVHVAEAPRSVPNAGVARHRAMMLGVAALGPEGGVLLSTDADGWPATDWLHATLAALRHAELVAGDIVRNGPRADERQDRIEAYYARLHALRRLADPVPWEAASTHHHASGANVALHSTTYAALGGFAPLASGEDARLIDDAGRAGHRVRRDAASIVHTSARRNGRARGGLATALRALDRDGLASVRVAHPLDQLWQYERHALARRAFAAGDLASFTPAIGLSADHLLGVARDCPNGEAFAMRVVPVGPQGMRQVPLPLAERTLAALLADATAARAA
ncbi:glycosyltransferase [uncultured Sphingomonas sp.]|uniref:glycosyltransferase n=1 Tax=uncultured Sphingomonas sp. TaxID=158754 RepID=UPI0030F9BAD4